MIKQTKLKKRSSISFQIISVYLNENLIQILNGLKMKITLLLLSMFLLLNISLFPQEVKENTVVKDNLNPTIISIPAKTPLSTALDYIGRLTKSKNSKVVINKIDDEILLDEDITNMHYLQALQYISDRYNFNLVQTDSAYFVENITDETEETKSGDEIFNSRQIKVDALLFEANTNELKKRGVNLQAILSKHGFVLGSNAASFLVSEDNPAVPDYNLNLQLEGDIGPFSGYANALFNFLETEHLGEIVAQLSITVRDGERGVMQVDRVFLQGDAAQFVKNCLTPEFANEDDKKILPEMLWTHFILPGQ